MYKKLCCPTKGTCAQELYYCLLDMTQRLFRGGLRHLWQSHHGPPSSPSATLPHVKSGVTLASLFCRLVLQVVTVQSLVVAVVDLAAAVVAETSRLHSVFTMH